MCPAIEIKGKKIFRLGGLTLMWTERERTERPSGPVSPEHMQRRERILAMAEYDARYRSRPFA